MYNSHRRRNGLNEDDQNFQHVLNWINGFHQFEILVYDAQLTRFKRLSFEELRLAYRELSSIIPNESSSNGKVSEEEEEEAEEGGEEERAWDIHSDESW